MGSEWTPVSVEEIQADKKGAIAIGPFGSRMKSDCYVEKGVPVIRGTNLSGGPAFENDFVFITEEKADSLGSCNVYEDDLVFPHRGSIGEVGIVPSGERYVISSSLMKLTCDRNRVWPRYLFYFFKSHLGRYELLRNASTVGTPGIGQPLTSLKSIRLSLPPKRIQKSIAHILGTLDDKIELNRRMNETLESMARALFKSWFVDFDPVIDNALAAGNPIPEPLSHRAQTRRDLGTKRKPLPKNIQKLFPDSFVFDDEMGWIPEGWESKAIGDTIDLSYGKSLPAKKRTDGDVPVYGSGGVSGFHNQSLCKGPGIIVGRKGTVGSLYWVTEDYFPIDTVFFVVNKSDAPLYWIYQSLQLVDIKSMGADSAVPGVNRNAVYGRHLCLPTTKIWEVYSDKLEPMTSKMYELDSENQTLTKLRDTLLPKLLSGELRIPDAEKLVAGSL